jgi:hypothetical protein
MACATEQLKEGYFWKAPFWAGPFWAGPFCAGAQVAGAHVLARPPNLRDFGALVLARQSSFSRLFFGAQVVAADLAGALVFGPQVRALGALVLARRLRPQNLFFGAQVAGPFCAAQSFCTAPPFWEAPPFWAAPFWKLSPAWAASTIPNMATTEAASPTTKRLMVDSSSHRQEKM